MVRLFGFDLPGTEVLFKKEEGIGAGGINIPCTLVFREAKAIYRDWIPA